MQSAFHNRTLAKNITWKTEVLILKVYGVDFQGVGLVEFLWKTMAGILNLCFTLAIRFHDALHGFWAYRRTRTAALKAKLIQPLMYMRDLFLCEIFMDLQKAYDALYWYKCLEILSKYGVVPRVIRIIWTYWVWLIILAKSGGYYETQFKGYHGVTQGHPLTPIILNVVVDAVIRHWVTVVAATGRWARRDLAR